MRRVLFACSLCLWTCRAPIPDREPPAGGSASGSSWAVAPPAPAGYVQPVSRFYLTPPDEEARVFRGALSDYHLGKIRDRDLPKTLLERVVPAVSWVDEDALVLAPEQALAPGEEYAVASPALGLVALVRVVADAPDALPRLWPPNDGPGSAEYWLFCPVLPLGASSGEALALEPGPLPVWASVEQGCIRLVGGGIDGGRKVPPLAALGRTLEPRPLDVAPGSSPAPLACAPTEQPIGPGCMSVEDDRLVLSGPSVPTLWSVTGGEVDFLAPLTAGGRGVVRGLAPGKAQTLAFWSRDRFAELFRAETVVTTEPLSPRIVINEVLANPHGPEPAQEWIELYNDGGVPADLGAYVLADSGGEVGLPSHLVAPGGFVLLVREDFVVGGGGDVAPAPGTPALSLPSLGKSGLSNAGEALVLAPKAEGRASGFPATPKPSAGVSVARRAPFLLDGDAAGFCKHAAPGASPGAPNVCSDP